jgi:flagellar hook-associated protein 3 FlgL
MISKNLLQTLTKNREMAAELQMDIATTKQLRRPSDDPSGVLQLERFKSLQSRNEQYLRNLMHVEGFLQQSASAIDNISDTLSQVQQLARQGGTDTLSAEARASLANQVDNIMDTLVDLGNTKFKDKYIFAGTLNLGASPFTRAGDVVTYAGNGSDLRGKIGFDSEIAYNKTGADLFNPAGGVDIFATLADLKAALESNDGNAILAASADLETAERHILNVSAEVGVLQNRMSLTEQSIQNENLNLQTFISRLQDTDVAEAIVKYQTLETAITAGLRTTSDVIQTSLVDFIR